MNFDLSEEQSILADGLRRFALERYGVDQRRRYLAEPNGYSAENWRRLSDMGLFALPISERAGGLGGRAADLAAALDAIGYGLVVEPLLVRARAAALFDLGASKALHELWIERLLDGSAQFCFAESIGAGIHVEASPAGDLVSGAISFIPNAIGADAIIVLAGDTEPASAWLAQPDHLGVSLQGWRMIDGGYAGALTLQGAAFGSGERLEFTSDLRRWRAETRVAACAEMQGILRRLFEETLAYLKTRRQFGALIGSFQALQHRMARLYVVLEQGKSLLLRALATPDEDIDTWLHAQDSAASHFTRSAIGFAEQCVQLHGGMGVTDELLIGAGLKRLHVLTALARPPRR